LEDIEEPIEDIEGRVEVEEPVQNIESPIESA